MRAGADNSPPTWPVQWLDRANPLQGIALGANPGVGIGPGFDPGTDSRSRGFKPTSRQIAGSPLTLRHLWGISGPNRHLARRFGRVVKALAC